MLTAQNDYQYYLIIPYLSSNSHKKQAEEQQSLRLNKQFFPIRYSKICTSSHTAVHLSYLIPKIPLHLNPPARKHQVASGFCRAIKSVLLTL